ncbi:MULTISPECIES: ureidoglycolate lyase [unclassified Beijerinckia]|uniref:ureidoglycolate lyase n=1 Tax=unclassified Beijerinckia TaxID=2638183 RepID=UPI0008944540|nr:MULTISPECIES: ureidoglycolate lyase [unclassified Beijerinckia]MDH7794028.1 ureidoglycolate lyase [Beijerinckia sp. GAS462]SEB51748.1 Ureidoglycolate hydrolase (allantoin degradation) [Beijerinckia sp. 28-YEA-48]
MTTELALRPTQISVDEFALYGELIVPMDDGVLFGPNDARLDIKGGIPRLYIMRLQPRELQFKRITRHAAVTQCLAALGGREWLIAVAPPIVSINRSLMPDPSSIRAFRVSGNCAIKLHKGCWHAGPFFEGSEVDFINLELSDTNEVDHINCALDQEFGITMRFEV